MCAWMCPLLAGQNNLRRFLPAKIIKDERKAELARIIRGHHETHTNKKDREVQVEYMRRVKAWKVCSHRLFPISMTAPICVCVRTTLYACCAFLWPLLLCAQPQIYGSQFFHVEPQLNVEIPDEVFLAVNPRGILIINPETKDVLVEHPYSEVREVWALPCRRPGCSCCSCRATCCSLGRP